MHDIAIIGAGPAGLSAAITARARNKDVLVLSNKPQDSPLAKSHLIDNYPGLPKVSGLALLEQMLAQARSLGAHFEFTRVLSVLPMGEHFTLTTSDANFEARSVILALGTPQARAYPGEQEFLGRGVSYCATCDGMLYRNAHVVVVGENPEAAEEANFLAELGAKVFYLAPKLPPGLEQGIFQQAGRLLAIEGDMMGVTGVRFAEQCEDAGSAEADSDRAEGTLSCQGVFILRSQIAPSALIAGLELAGNFIAADANGCTNIPGVFAAGDCVGKPLQVAKAVGQGQLAAFAAVEHLG
ncbi:MAG: NAD(P)/FAD-dependent oxidoreductase [Coriobacteriales bacterium]|jgi:thioredoxin reductase (NADPH)|nr:NAD(P)/FAD-dependent oxidoreductase [Coriobacteriales bacterium]